MSKSIQIQSQPIEVSQPTEVGVSNKRTVKGTNDVTGVGNNVDMVKTLAGKQKLESEHSVKSRVDFFESLQATKHLESAATKHLESAMEAASCITKQPVISDDAKAVYQDLKSILTKTKESINGDFFHESIGGALKTVLEGGVKLSKEGSTCTIGMYNEILDGSEWRGKATTKSSHGLSAPNAWKEDNGKRKSIDEGQKQCLAALTNAHIEAQPKNEDGSAKEVEEVLKTAPNPQNIGNCDFSGISDSDSARGIYKFKDKASGQETTYTWDNGFDPKKYSNQISREFNTFSGDVKIHKLEPGTVLVRVFGKGQSVKSSCWCKADDLNSSVTCAADLYKKLAVKAEWNGDGNMGVLIVPHDADIWVAEGKIASQAEKYTEKDGEGEKETQQKYTFLYEGGGTQLNILTPNDEKDFAGVDPKVFTNCLFCFRDDNIIPEEAFSFK